MAQRVQGVVARSVNHPVEVVTIEVPDPGPGEALVRLPSRDFPLLVDLHLQGRLPLERFVSERIGLDEVEEAFARMARGEVLRSVVVL